MFDLIPRTMDEVDKDIKHVQVVLSVSSWRRVIDETAWNTCMYECVCEGGFTAFYLLLISFQRARARH